MRMTSIPSCLALATVTALMLTACHSSSPVASSAATQAPPASAGATAADSTTSTTAAASDAAAASGSTGASAAAVIVCTVLPTSQAASLSGVAVATSREQDDPESNAARCDYFPASGTGGFSVSLTSVRGAQAYANFLQNDTIAGAAEHVAPLTGVGDKAFSAQDGVRAVFGDRMIYVAGLATDPPAVAIIKALQAKLG